PLHRPQALGGRHLEGIARPGVRLGHRHHRSRREGHQHDAVSAAAGPPRKASRRGQYVTSKENRLNTAAKQATPIRASRTRAPPRYRFHPARRRTSPKSTAAAGATAAAPSSCPSRIATSTSPPTNRNPMISRKDR